MKSNNLIAIDISENGRITLANESIVRELRLKKMVDGFIKIEIPSMGITTWVKNSEDAKVVISEAIEIFMIMKKKIFLNLFCKLNFYLYLC